MPTPEDLVKYSIRPLKPGSPEWWATISASKVSAILDVNPWDSRFNIWHTMHGDIVPDPQENRATERGTYLEPSVLTWFRDQKRGELEVFKGGMLRHPQRANWVATPDALAVNTHGHVEGVEAKTSEYRTEWGQEGTAEIPPYYLTQALWQIVVLGVDTVWVPVLFGQGFSYAIYKVTRDDVANMIPFVLEEVDEFERSLAEHRPPPLDGSTATYVAVKKLHPLIDDEDYEIPDDLARRFLAATQISKVADDAVQRYRSEIGMAMGNNRRARWNGQTIFTRQAKGGGLPYMSIAKKLPDISKENNEPAPQ